MQSYMQITMECLKIFRKYEINFLSENCQYSNCLHFNILFFNKMLQQKHYHMYLRSSLAHMKYIKSKPTTEKPLHRCSKIVIKKILKQMKSTCKFILKS